MGEWKGIQRVGIVFSGGPAPAANAVVSACALQFLDAGVEVIGILDGFRHLVERAGAGLEEGRHYLRLGIGDVSGIRNREAVLLRTSHVNPNDGIEGPADLADPRCNSGIAAVHASLAALELDAIVTVGGDETLRAANHLRLLQDSDPTLRRIRVVHLPKTIDNDYFGIDWTFGFNSAADFAAREIRNLGADAQSTSTWYVLELMGRQAGWLTYAAGIAGAATRMISVEDVQGAFDVAACGAGIVDLMLAREEAGKPYGIVCVAEGLAALIDEADGAGVDGGGYSRLGSVRVAERLAQAIEERYRAQTGRSLRVRSKQIGYETRCTEPVAFDILLGSQLGVGAFRALAELGLDGCMVSVRDQLELVYVPLADLVDPETLRTRIRFVPRDSDFYRLARALEYEAGHGAKA